MTYNISIRIFFLFFLIATLGGCDDNYRSSIPDYPVFLELNLTSTYPTFKNNPNQYLVFEIPPRFGESVGFGGILVYVGFDGKYYAFDLACPHESKFHIKVRPNDLGQAVCDSCQTVFDISFGLGVPIEGPAKETLKKYKTVYKSTSQGDILSILR